jgi:hypothetical protein
LCRDKNGAVPAKIDGKPSIASRYRRIQLFFLSALQAESSMAAAMTLRS